jgi:hypothetical protein
MYSGHPTGAVPLGVAHRHWHWQCGWQSQWLCRVRRPQTRTHWHCSDSGSGRCTGTASALAPAGLGAARSAMRSTPPTEWGGGRGVRPSGPAAKSRLLRLRPLTPFKKETPVPPWQSGADNLDLRPQFRLLRLRPLTPFKKETPVPPWQSGADNLDLRPQFRTESPPNGMLCLFEREGCE